jgi:hypothetical protein
VFAAHCNPSDDVLEAEIDLGELGESAPSGEVIVWDWRARTATRVGRDDRWPVSLPNEGWAYLVLAPVLDGGLAVIGDVTKDVPAGDARLEVDPIEAGVRLTVKGAGETVTITGWAQRAPTVEGVAVDHDPASGLWRLLVTVPSRGWITVDLAA